MTQKEWIEEFARILADKLDEPVEAFHLNCGSYWAMEMECWGDEWGWEPADAVDEELSNWGD